MEHGWIELRQAALLESDEHVLLVRLAMAKRAIRAFAGELEGSSQEQKEQGVGS